MKSYLVFLLTIIFLGGMHSTSFSQVATSVVQHKVVIQLNTADTTAWSATIGNVRNLQKIWPSNLQVEVVVHGKALDLLVKEKTHLAADIIALTKEGIRFSACENSMKKHHIEKAALLVEAFTVPSGVAEVILKQEQGWSYLKAGVN